MTREQDEQDPALLHIHGQPSWHTEAYVLGNRDGLLALRAAIDGALAYGEGVAEVMVADGEGYSVVAVLEEAAWDSPGWERVAVPYTAADATENRDNAIWPWHRQPKREEKPV